MTKYSKLQRLREVFDPNSGTRVDFIAFDSEVAKLKEALTDKIQAQTIDDVLAKLEKFKKKIDLKVLVQALEDYKEFVEGKIESISNLMNEKMSVLKKLLQSNDQESRNQVSAVSRNIEFLRQELGILNEKTEELTIIKTEIGELQDFNKRADEILNQIQDSIESNDKNTNEIFNKEMEKIRREFNNRLGNLGHGGNANRDITIGGNASTLSKYADINFKAGSNITLTYSNNDTSKQLDFTIAAQGGAGTVRTIATTVVSSIIGAVANTDYVVLASEGVQITLPTAVSNTNLYTIKNIGTSSVLIATTGGQTIDESGSINMPVQYTAVDIISDNSNWHVT